MNRALCLVISFFVMLSAFCAIALGQGGTGELTGRVVDPSGAILGNISVVLTNAATGEKRTTVTTSAGTYRFPALPVVGSYTLRITAKGFRTAEIADVVVSVGTVVTHDVSLEVGTETEVLTVEAGVQQVQAQDSSLSGLVDRRVWQDMPLEVRSQNEFINMLAGAEPAANAMLGTDRGAAVNGARSGTGNFLVEGFDNNDQGLGGGGSSVGPGGANTTIDPDAIQEYRVIEHIPPAEYGQAGGFVTDTVLKSGTNRWHGSLFEYNRVQALAANSFFSDRNDVQDSLVRNQFGGSIGGPIVKDHSFFFFTVENHRLRSSSPVSATTMTSDFLNFVNSGAFETFQESDPNGVCVQVLGGACPGALAQNATLGPIFSALQSKQNMPLCTPGAANCTNLTNGGQGLYTGGFLGGQVIYPVPVYGLITLSQPTSLNQMRYTAKLDQTIGSKDQLSGAFLYDNADSATAYAGGDNTLGPTLFNHTRAQNAGITWSHTFNPAVLNQARIAYVRHTSNFPGDPSLAEYPSVVTAYDSPTFAYGNASNLPQFFTENAFQYKDDLSITRGKHNFKTGVEYRRTRNGSSFDADKNGLFVPNDVEDLVTDMTFSDLLDNLAFGGPTFGSWYEAEASVNPATGGLPVYYRGFRANEWAAYGQDDWRISSRLTLNLGLRWEYFGPPHNFQSGVDSNFYPGARTTPFATASDNPYMPVNIPFYAGIATGVSQVKDNDVWNKDMNNFGPRLGFAWDALGTQKLVVRGGYGISYDRMYNNIFENLRFNPPTFAFALIGYANGTPGGSVFDPGIYSAPFTSTSAFAAGQLTPSLRAIDPNLKTAYYEQANFGIEYQIGRDMVLESNYVGTFGHDLIGVLGWNTFDGRFAAGYSHLAINPNYSSISARTNCCDSNYNAWQTSLRKRFSSGLQFQASYTFSKALDDISDAFTTKNASSAAYPTDSMNPSFDYGPADFDVRHRAVVSFVYDLPFAKGNRWIGGWNVSGIVSVQTGSPFSITDSASNADTNEDGQFNDRASYIGSGAITNAINHSKNPADGYLSAADWAMPTCPPTINGGLWCEGAAVGQMRRNSLTGPGYFNTDLGIEKSFKITENSRLTLQGNFFNIFNHPNFDLPDNNLNDSTFGQSTSTFDPGPGGARVIQLALRFDF